MLGIKEIKPSVYEEELADIEFRDNLYLVRVSIKNNISFVSDSYQNSVNRLNNLKREFNQNTEMFKTYVKVIYEQVNNSIMGFIESTGTQREESYLPHQTVMLEDRSSTKLRIAFGSIG